MVAFVWVEKSHLSFFNTMEDAGALPVECDVQALNMGDVIDVYPYEGKITKHDSDEVLCEFSLKTEIILDEVQAGGRIPLIIGRGLTERAREALGTGSCRAVSPTPIPPLKVIRVLPSHKKMVGQACGVEGIRPGTYCEPRMTTVGSQDTTGPMTRDELKDLACLGFSADLVMPIFLSYSGPIRNQLILTLSIVCLISYRHAGGVALRPGDGIIHSWLNRMLLPDTVVVPVVIPIHVSLWVFPSRQVQVWSHSQPLPA